MGIVSDWVDVAQGQLDGVAGSIFGEVVSAAGATVSAMATLVIVFLGINLVMQYRPMSAGYVLITVIKLVVIVGIGLRWGQFNTIASAIISAMNSLGAVMLSGVGPGGTLAGAIDNLFSMIASAANRALEPLSWMTGAFLSVVIAVGLGLISAIIALALIFASVVLTFYLGIAPIFIALSVFETTKDFFSRWLQSTIAYALVPVVLGGVLGGMVRIVKSYMDTLSSGDAGTSIAGFIPFLSILGIMFFIIIMIPQIVSGLTGMMQFSGPLAPVIRTMATLAAANKGLAMTIQKFSGSGGGDVSNPSGAANQQSANRSATPPISSSPAAKIAARSQKYK